MHNDQIHPTMTPCYRVFRNEEGRAAVWPDTLSLPDGWTATDMTGSREECLAYIQLFGAIPAPRCRVDTSVVVA